MCYFNKLSFFLLYFALVFSVCSAMHYRTVFVQKNSSNNRYRLMNHEGLFLWDATSRTYAMLEKSKLVKTLKRKSTGQM